MQQTLNKVMRYPEGTMSRRNWLILKKSKGATVRAVTTRMVDKEAREQEYLHRQKNNVPWGNPNYPTTKAYLERKALLEAGFFTTNHSLTDGEVSYDITKTEFDYFNQLP